MGSEYHKLPSDHHRVKNYASIPYLHHEEKPLAPLRPKRTVFHLFLGAFALSLFALFTTRSLKNSNLFQTESLEGNHVIDFIKEIPSTESLHDFYLKYASTSSVAGDGRDLAQWTRDQWEAFGLKNASLETYYPYLNYPKKRALSIVNGQDILYEVTLLESDEDIPMYHDLGSNKVLQIILCLSVEVAGAIGSINPISMSWSRVSVSVDKILVGGTDTGGPTISVSGGTTRSRSLGDGKKIYIFLSGSADSVFSVDVLVGCSEILKVSVSGIAQEVLETRQGGVSNYNWSNWYLNDPGHFMNRTLSGGKVEKNQRDKWSLLSKIVVVYTYRRKVNLVIVFLVIFVPAVMLVFRVVTFQNSMTLDAALLNSATVGNVREKRKTR
ncbi:hypothetical protein K501DRAFT_271244 [Backusella circina FSU 941]|nr:hypothetical protein K501DRAFT_271244 [Backusella circina FSU 941]